MDKVDELIRGVAIQLAEFDNRDYASLPEKSLNLFGGLGSKCTYKRRARQILLHPGLALIDKDKGVIQKCHVWEYPVIILSEALKENRGRDA